MSHNGRLVRSSAYRPARRAADVLMLGVFQTLALCYCRSMNIVMINQSTSREHTSEICESLLLYSEETV